jgi:hypothetical protein
MEITQQQMKEWMDKLQDTAKIMQDAKKAMQAAETPVRNWITVSKVYELLVRLQAGWRCIRDQEGRLDDGIEHFRNDEQRECIRIRQDNIDCRLYPQKDSNWGRVVLPDGTSLKTDDCKTFDSMMHQLVWGVVQDLAWKEMRKKQ